MFFAACEVLHGGAETLARKRPDIHLQAFASQSDAGLVYAPSQHFMHARMSRHTFQRADGAWSGNQQIEVADRLSSSPQTARRRDRLDAVAVEIGYEFIGGLLGEAKKETPGSEPVLRDGTKDLFFELRAHARQIAELLIAA